MATMTYADKKRAYLKVFFGLCLLTVAEVAIVYMTFLAPIVITLGVVIMSLGIAFLVGWVYMHLNHETKGLKIFLLFPLFVSFFYATWLIVDARFRPASPYLNPPVRSHVKAAQEKADKEKAQAAAAMKAEKEAEQSQETGNGEGVGSAAEESTEDAGDEGEWN